MSVITEVGGRAEPIVDDALRGFLIRQEKMNLTKKSFPIFGQTFIVRIFRQTVFIPIWATTFNYGISMWPGHEEGKHGELLPGISEKKRHKNKHYVFDHFWGSVLVFDKKSNPLHFEF